MMYTEGYVSIDGVAFDFSNASTFFHANAGSWKSLNRLLPVSKGSLVKISDIYKTDAAIYCYFIPLKAIAAPTLDYSIEEQDTGQKWINGKAIYQRTFTATTGTGGALGATPSPVKVIHSFPPNCNVVKVEGFLEIEKSRYPHGFHSSGGFFSLAISTANQLIATWASDSNSADNCPVTATAWYTKD